MKPNNLMKQVKTKMSFTIGMIAVIFVVSGCTEDQTGTMAPGPSEGTLNIELTDAPINLDLVEEANVTISKIEIRKDAEGQLSDSTNPFLVVYDSTQTYDLLDLRNGVTETLVDQDVPAGSYDLIRLYVDSAGLTLTNGMSYDVKVPSGGETGVKVFIEPALQVQGGFTTDVLLDFDVSKSFIMKGNLNSPAGVKGFNFKPVIRAVNETTAGTIGGMVTDTSESAIEGAAVWIEQDTVVTTTYSDSTGGYAILGVEEGNYDLFAAKEDYDTLMVNNVEVTAGSESTYNLELTPIEETASQ